MKSSFKNPGLIQNCAIDAAGFEHQSWKGFLNFTPKTPWSPHQHPLSVSKVWVTLCWAALNSYSEKLTCRTSHI